MDKQPTLAIIGFGRLGGALAQLARDRGYRIAAVAAASAATRAKATAQHFPVFSDNSTAAHAADLILLCVPDRQISAVCGELVANGRLRADQVLLHTSGASGAELLADARTAGVAVGSLHPLQSFADASTAAENLPGSAFAIDGDPAATTAAAALAQSFGGQILIVPPAERALYHAAAVITSNYLVTLLATAQTLFARWAPDETAARAAMLPLAAGTLRNINRQGAKAALTGPIVRGDATTVEKHLAALPKELIPLYRQLGLATLSLAEDSLTDQQIQALQRCLHAPSNV